MWPNLDQMGTVPKQKLPFGSCSHFGWQSLTLGAPMSFKLIVNADDFGLTKGVNRSVLDCHLAGGVTSTTLMVNMAAAEDAAEIARRHQTLGVGLHFNLTSGRPVTPAHLLSSLVDDDGNFLGRGELIRRVLSGRVSSVEIASELEAQWRRLQDLGIHPTHIDSHQHVHALPQIFRVVSHVCALEDVSLRVTWRWPGRLQRKSLRRRLSEAVLESMTSRCMALKPVNVRTNDGLCSVFDLDQPPESLSEASYYKLLDAYRDGVVELMVHPAEVDLELRSQTQITTTSAVENMLLRSAFLLGYVKRRQGRLVNYSDLGRT